MNLSDIRREQANAAATLKNIDEYVASGGQLSPGTVYFLTEEAEGAFNQYRDAARAMGITQPLEKTTAQLAKEYIRSAINNTKNRAH